MLSDVFWLVPMASIDLGELLKNLVAAAGLIGFLAAGAQFYRGSADKGTITSLQNSVNALETAGEIKDEKIAELIGKVSDMTNELEVWRNAVTAKEELTKLQGTFLEHHIESMRLVHEMLAGIQVLMGEHTLTRDQLEVCEKKISQEATEVKKLVARMHSELAEVRNVVKP